MKKYILITILGLVLAIPVSAGWWSDFFRTEKPIEEPILAGSYSPFMLNGTTIKPKVSTWGLEIASTTFTNAVFTNATTSHFAIIGLGGGGGDLKIAADGSVYEGTDAVGTGWTFTTTTLDYWFANTAGIDTDGLGEGSTNLYYTQARVWGDVWASTTLDTLLTNSQTAYGWGDHSVAGYLNNLNAETLGSIGDVSTTTLAYGSQLTWDTSNWVSTSTIYGFSEAWATSYNATTTLSGFTPHNAVTIAGEDYASLSTQEITFANVDAANIDLTDAFSWTGAHDWDTEAIFNGNVGIGTTEPGALLHVSGGLSGASVHGYTKFLVEGSNHIAMQTLTPNTKTVY